jgi:MoaA/NifB/PqqE/SkfB family radical SAM enzyme
LLYSKWAEKIKGLVDMLHFSLDASTADLHDKMRGVKCFDSVINSIHLAKSLGERPDVLFTAFSTNLEELEKVHRNITLPNDLVLIINPEFSYGEINGENNLNDSQLGFLSAFGKRKKVYLNEAFIKLRKDGGNHIDKPVCKAASTTLVISPENKLIVPCYHLGEKEFEINDSLYRLFYSKEVESIKSQEGKLKACESCVINCYMQPSFAVNVNKYWWSALSSTLKYNRLKGTWKALF